ncbi:MAG: SxtJ family membrane protein, partial [Isosphaeraceae bacterium]
FAGLWIACFGALAAWEWFGRGHHTLATALAAAALLLGPLGLVWPRLLKPVYVAWMVLAFPIGWTISQVIVGLIFYGLFTPLGLLFRIIGRDALHRTRQPALDSYWSPKATPSDPRRYFKQF